jgi:hypothetical protein
MKVMLKLVILQNLFMMVPVIYIIMRQNVFLKGHGQTMKKFNN